MQLGGSGMVWTGYLGSTSRVPSWSGVVRSEQARKDKEDGQEVGPKVDVR